MSAAAAHESVIFVPHSAPQAKIAQLLVYGSRVLAVDGTYDDAFDLCVRACEEFGWYNRNTGYNPFMTEGKKTVSFEIAAQLAEAEDSYSRKGEITVLPLSSLRPTRSSSQWATDRSLAGSTRVSGN